MGLSLGFDEGFFNGASAASSSVPSLYDVALDGRNYLIDRASDRHRHQTIPVLRYQTQTSDRLGEQSINPAGLWRSSAETWHRGAGQDAFDLNDSVTGRFRSSKGVDIWTPWELTLLPDTDEKLSSAATNLQLLPVGSYLYVSDGSALKYTQDITAGTPSWTTVTGTSGNTITSMATDGFNIYITDGTAIYNTTRGAATAASWNTQDCDLLGFAKGRLMGAHDELVFNILSSSTKFDVVTHDNTDFRWVGFADGINCIYMAGFSGDKSQIWRTAVKADGTSLDTGTIAGVLPDGEIVRTIYGYLGFLFIGTDKGIRLAIPSEDGDLTIGELIETSAAVKCFEGQGKFVWYGLTNYDGTSTGLGRLTPATLNDSAPAYASDLMATEQGAVLSACTFQNIRVFTISGQGVWAEDTVKVASGSVDGGLVTFGIADDKVALFADVRHETIDGTVNVAISTDGGTFTSIGSSESGTGTVLPVGELTGQTFEVRLTLTRDAGDSTTGPVVTRFTLKMNPTADTGFLISCPIQLNEWETPQGSTKRLRDPAAELAHIQSLRSSRNVVLYQELGSSYAVSLEDFEWIPKQATSDRRAHTGTCVLSLKVV